MSAQNSRRKNAALGQILLFAFGAVFALASLAGFSDPVDLSKAKSHVGYLIDASRSHGRFGNNTSIRIMDEAGETHSYEIKSSIKVNEVGRIRDLANNNRKRKVNYVTQSEKLISMTFADGEPLVSVDHVRSQRAFTNWSMLVFGFLFLGFAFFERRGRAKSAVSGATE